MGPTMDRHGHDGPSSVSRSKTLRKFWNLSTEMDSLNSVTDLQDGPSQARQTVVIHRFENTSTLENLVQGTIL